MALAIVDVLEEEVGLSAEAKQAWLNGLHALNAGIAKNLKYVQSI